MNKRVKTVLSIALVLISIVVTIAFCSKSKESVAKFNITYYK